MDAIIHPYWDEDKSLLAKGAPASVKLWYAECGIFYTHNDYFFLE